MELLPKDVILEFQPDTLSAVRKIHNLHEPEKMKEKVEALKEWIKNQEHLEKKDYDQQYLENTIISSKGSLERAQIRMGHVFRLRTQLPQYFGDFDIRNDFKDLDGKLTQAVLPKLTKDHQRVIILRNTGKKFESTLVLQAVRIYTMIFEYLKNHDYSDGIILIVDLREASLMDAIRNISLFDIRQGASILIEGYGVRAKGLHMLSNSRFINIVVWIFKQVLSKKLVGRLHVHQNLNTLHEFVSKDVLPVEYGGTQPSFTNIHEKWLNVLSSNEYKDYLKEMKKACFKEPGELKKKSTVVEDAEQSIKELNID